MSLGSFRVVLVGNTGCGKTALGRRLVKDEYVPSHDPTIGAAFFQKQITTDRYDKEAPQMKMELWDTAGQERFRSLAPMYYRSAHLIVFCYSVANYQSFADLRDTWIKSVQESTKKKNSFYFVLLGCKADRTTEREVAQEEAHQLAESIGAVYGDEISAMDGTGIQALEANLAHILAAISSGSEPIPQLQFQGVGRLGGVRLPNASVKVKLRILAVAPPLKE